MGGTCGIYSEILKCVIRVVRVPIYVARKMEQRDAFSFGWET